MASSAQEIARDLVVAWLSNTDNVKHLGKKADAQQIGALIGELYTAVLKAVERATEAAYIPPPADEMLPPDD
jgi:hypothetical protein